MDTLTLAAHGRTDWQIVLPPAPTASEQYAAEELARFLKESTGATFRIVALSETADRHRIFLGFPLWNAPGGLNPVQRGMGKEEFYIQTLDDDLILTGGRPRGTLYAVYEFLDTVVGCRWYTSEVSRIPHHDVLEIPFLSIHKTPALTYREDYNFCAFDPDWASRNRLNGPSHRLETKHGGTDRYNTYSGGAHSFDLLVPVEEYFDTHPEYFSEVDGVRIKDHTQLCLTNPEVVEISQKRVLEWIRKDPEGIRTLTNHNGGINGGISNGMPLLFRCAVKPTPSISKEQLSVNGLTGENETLQVRGRHDPAIVHRARVVVDSVTALVLCDQLAQRFGTDWLGEAGI